MLSLSLLLGAALACDAGTSPPIGPPGADSSYRTLFDSGKTFADFLAGAQRRKEQWERNFAAASVPDALLTRARAAAGPWKVLVVAVDGCSDSVNTIPYLARLTTQLIGVDMRIIGSDLGRAIMDAHKTPDGRGATPTVLLLDANYAERGCFIERPKELQSWIMDQKGKLSDTEVFDRKMQWYDEDKGNRTLQDFVDVMERASRGEPACEPKR